MPFYKLLSLLLAFSMIFLNGWSQDDSTDQPRKPLLLKTDFQAGILAGGQLGNEKFTYKPGIMGQFCVNTRISPVIHAGIGVALISLENETILPVFADVRAFFKGEDSSFIGLNIGASAAWTSVYRNVSQFEYEGGLYFSPYYSFQFPVNEDINLLFATGIVHHTGEVEFLSEFGEKYEERFAMDFLTIRVGLRF